MLPQKIDQKKIGYPKKNVTPQKNSKKWLPQKFWRTLLRGGFIINFWKKWRTLFCMGLLMRFKH